MATKSPHKAPGAPGFSLISNEKLQQMYVTMLRCRMLDPHVRKIAGSAALKGKEAAFVGAAIDLKLEDAIIDSSHGATASFLKSAPLHSILGPQYALDIKHAKAKRKTAVGAAAEWAVATGIGYALVPKKKESVTVAFLSSNPAGSEAGRAALLFASARKLPIIYVYTGERPLNTGKINGSGFPVIPVDGNDVVAVYRVAHECTVRARRGSGPSVIACHFSLANQNNRDPLRNMENYLSMKGLFNKKLKQSTVHAFEKEIDRAAKASRNLSMANELQNVFIV